jgi:hypothetical protein
MNLKSIEISPDRDNRIQVPPTLIISQSKLEIVNVQIIPKAVKEESLKLISVRRNNFAPVFGENEKTPFGGLFREK